MQELNAFEALRDATRESQLVSGKLRELAPKPAEPQANGSAALGPVHGAIFKLTQKAPRSPRELLAAKLSTTGGTYQATKELKEKGSIESREDADGDGQRKWFVTRTQSR